MTYNNPLAIADQAIDHQLSQLGTSIRFILDVTPTDAADVKESFLDGDVDEPTFTYRDLPTDPEVLHAILNSIDVGRVEDATVASLLRKKHRELGLQLTMLRVRDTPDFRPLSIELYGGVAPDLVTAAESIMTRIAGGPSTADKLDADAFLALAEAEIDHYRALEPDIDIHAEIRHDVTGVMVSDNILLIGPESSVATDRAQALVQHEVGTHLVTQVNGSHQPLKVLATGLAGYDETQEGLAVLAEIACGELTGSRLRQLAARVLTVHRMLDGASFRECFDALVEADVPRGIAFTTTMRIFRAGGLTKDAIYLRGLLDLLRHLRREEASLAPFVLGKFALDDLPLIEELNARGVLHAPVLIPRWFDDPASAERLRAAVSSDDPVHLIQGAA